MRSAADLAADSRNTYTLILQVSDGGRSSKSGTTVVTINVERNLFAPSCVGNGDVFQVNYTLAPGSVIGSAFQVSIKVFTILYLCLSILLRKKVPIHVCS